MLESKQTLASIKSDFDRIAMLSDEAWNHNRHYHKLLLKQLPERCGDILEIGCGTGEFTRLLAARAAKVTALDLSPQMIRVARERSRLYPNIDYVECDAMTYGLPDHSVDGIATLATLHHLPLEAVLKKISQALKPGGVFICLDLYERATLSDVLGDALAYPANLLLRTLKTGKPRPPREMRAAYAEHGTTDTYPTLSQIKRICDDILAGARVRRHLFWRYSIIWKK